MRLLRALLAAASGALLVAGCSGKPSAGAIQVRVKLAPGLKSVCVRVLATSASGGAPLESNPISLAGKSSPLVVGIQPSGQTEPITVQAVGFSDVDCNSRTVPAEVSETASGRFAFPPTELEVTLAPVAGDDGGVDAGTDAGVDQDMDGFPLPVDCDDTNPLIKPGVQEVCTDRVDNDCDQATDCADSACDALMCAVGGGAACASSICRETSCGDNLDNDDDSAMDCADLDCLGQSCGVGGTCTAVDGGLPRCVAPTETNACADGQDNDGDLLVDCADPDCPSGAMCSDLNACTLMDTCDGDGGCTSGGPKQCTMPPNPVCYSSPGVCLPDAGGDCDYTLNLGQMCSDGLGCTTGDACDADGGCTGTPTVCMQTANVCRVVMGACQEPAGTCTFQPLATGPCSDGDNCTINDTCDGDGGCAGAPVTCTPPDQCQTKTGCDADGGCQFAIAPGQVCDAGVAGQPGSCTAGGACQAAPTNVFPFTPSNFTEMELPVTAGSRTYNCNVTLDTGLPMAASLTWTGTCVGTPPAFTEVTLGTGRGVLLFFDALTISAGSTFQVTGGRPLILAVRNDATIDGILDVGSSATRAGPGADRNCTGASGGNGGAGSGAGDDTGGGGGGGAFGSNGGAGAAGSGASAGSAGAAIAGTAGLVPLRGGCNGGNGGRVSAPNGAGGTGGGAVQLAVGGVLSIGPMGRVTAYGEGGGGGLSVGSGATRGGGGGGGSGGGILLEAATVTLNATGAVTANGGGGGEGAGQPDGDDGDDGSQATSTVAAGGVSGTCGGDGGNGAAGTTGAAPGVAATCTGGDSGGGGGGGVGRIFIRASAACTLSGVVSPPARGSGANGCPPVP